MANQKTKKEHPLKVMTGCKNAAEFAALAGIHIESARRVFRTPITVNLTRVLNELGYKPSIYAGPGIITITFTKKPKRNEPTTTPTPIEQ